MDIILLPDNSLWACTPRHMYALSSFNTRIHALIIFQAYTVLESSTNALFLHMTMSEEPYYGNILKSNSNGTYFGLSIENVNRNNAGYVDFEKMIGLDGIALINIVSNPGEAKVSKKKSLRTRITHNDGLSHEVPDALVS